MNHYFEKIINEERGRKFRVHCRWQAPENKLDIYSHRESRFKNSTILAIALAKSNIEEVEDSRNRIYEEIEDLKKSQIQEIEDLKKSKIQ
jgi:hypothetical protein